MDTQCETCENHHLFYDEVDDEILDDGCVCYDDNADSTNNAANVDYHFQICYMKSNIDCPHYIKEE
ncbi:MAG: hypothetical protein KAJ03_01825 [Gammaproteobacteria bacterium]|nr:hypothetical protein [Gammaproteobacteria bacterium]